MPWSRRKTKSRRRQTRQAVLLLLLLGVSGWYYYGTNQSVVNAPATQPPITPHAASQTGRILAIESATTYTAAEAGAIARENYGNTLPVDMGVTKVVFRYRSYALDGTPIAVYARAYIPAGPASDLPIFAFAPGTTGIGDQCAGSLEQPKVANWANYDSHMMMYAAQGYASVITDYEGMRDPDHLHHYMVGELEGRAVLDSVRGLEHLPQTAGRLDAHNIFLGGYSQGGHAAFWADKIQAAYAPELNIKGVVGFGPVMNVKETLTDVTRSANINWFGPYILASYGDYYHRDYGTGRILLPTRAEHLLTDVTSHCIDTVLGFWGHTPQGVYTPEFIQAMATGDWSAFATFDADLQRNAIGDQATTSAKRINQGELDNVVLPRQQDAVMPTLCAKSRGPVQLHVYPGTTHYNTMLHSLVDTLAWMKDLRAGRTPAATCPATPSPAAPSPAASNSPS